MIRAIAIDDEPIALEIITLHAEKIPFLAMEATFINAFDAIDYLNKVDVDLIFLDIKMPDISGIDFYHALTQKPLLIFTTAYSEHAVTGFDLQATDYLLKPFTFVRFLQACHKAAETLRHHSDTPNHLFIKDGYDLVKIIIEEILFIEATGNYMKYVCQDKEILTRSTMKETLEILPRSSFIQIHRSYIVHIRHIHQVERHQLYVGAHQIPIGASYTQNLKKIVIFSYN